MSSSSKPVAGAHKMMRFQPLSRRRLRTAGCFLLLFTLGCSTDTRRGAESSTITFAITDAASDEIASFSIDLKEVELTRENGEIVDLSSTDARVDVASLVDISQVLNVRALAPGLYTEARVTVDYSQAACFLVGASSEASILDGDGLPVAGSVTYPIVLAEPLIVRSNRNHVLELEFDLDRSLEVDIASNVVVLEPALALRLDGADTKTLALAGELRSVNVDGGSFELELQNSMGERIVDVLVVAPNALYQVDGRPSVGGDGLEAISSAGPGLPVQCYGVVQPGQRRIDADLVVAGLGSFHGRLDRIEGHVTGRMGGPGDEATLTVLGRGQSADGATFFADTNFTVLCSFDETVVVMQGDAGLHDTDDITIGQRVAIFGDLDGTTMMDARNELSLVRLLPTRVSGFATESVVGDTLTVDLARVDRRDEGLFLWSEGGTTPPDPDAFTIDVGSSTGGFGIGIGTAIEAVGNLAAIDDGDQDFVASRVSNLDTADSLIVIRDRPGGMEVTLEVELSSASNPCATLVHASRIRFLIDGVPGVGEAARLDRGFAGTSDLPNSIPLTILAICVDDAEGEYLYSLRNRGTGVTRIFGDVALFGNALEIELGRGPSSTISTAWVNTTRS